MLVDLALLQSVSYIAGALGVYVRAPKQRCGRFTPVIKTKH
jgi:hypothetical protein